MRHLLPCLVLALLLAPAVATAAEGGKGGGEGGGAATGSRTYTGTITKISYDTNAVIVTGRAANGENTSVNRVFTITKETTVGGVKATGLGDLKVGQDVRVTHTQVDVAERFEVLPKGGAGQKKGG